MIPDRMALFGLSLGGIITLSLAAQSSLVKVMGPAGLLGGDSFFFLM